MCYHASVSLTYSQLEEALNKPFDGAEFPTFFTKDEVVGYHLNGFSHPAMPVVLSEDPMQIHFAKWGLIPSWTRDFETAKKLRVQTLNAKAETIFEKPSFRKAVSQQRCIVPVTGFFEWQDRGANTKVPWFIHGNGTSLLLMAGIYDTWYHEAEDLGYRTFSVVTTAANALMSDIHNSKQRMPLILDREVMEAWLNPDAPKELVRSLMVPFPQESMEAYTISGLITSRKFPSNVPEVLLPQDYPATDLFS